MPTWPQIAQPLCRLTPGFVEAERCGFDGKVVSTMGARRTWPLVFELTCLSNNRGANVSLTSKDSLGVFYVKYYSTVTKSCPFIFFFFFCFFLLLIHYLIKSIK